MSAVSPDLRKRLTSETGKKRVLHVYSAQAGSGRLHSHFHAEGWEEIRLDPFPGHAPDIIGDWKQLPDLPDNCVNAIWSSHALQRLHISEVPKALKECYRILKDGGMMLLTAPDLQCVAKSVWEGKSPTDSLVPIGKPPLTPNDLLFGAFKEPPPLNLIHQCAFTGSSLGLALKAAGFFNIEIKRGDDFVLWGVAYRIPAGQPRQEKVLINDKFAPRSIIAQSGLVDELNVPPHFWKPLGLKK